MSWIFSEIFSACYFYNFFYFSFFFFWWGWYRVGHDIYVCFFFKDWKHIFNPYKGKNGVLYDARVLVFVNCSLLAAVSFWGKIPALSVYLMTGYCDKMALPLSFKIEENLRCLLLSQFFVIFFPEFSCCSSYRIY